MKRIAILTFHNAKNYGAVLQTYALQEYIKTKFESSVHILNYTPAIFKVFFNYPSRPLAIPGFKNKIKAIIKNVIYAKEMKKKDEKYRGIDRFVNEHLILTKEIKELNQELDYDIFISGSDQIWNLELIKNDINYLLCFTNKRKISYAASFKISDVDSYAEKAYFRFLPQYSSISVRESDLKSFLFEKFNLKSSVVLDPTLLSERTIWSKFIKRNLISQNYLLLYFVNKPQVLIDKAFEYAEKNKLVVVSLNHLRKEKRKYIDLSEASVEDFINLFFYSDVVFTTSFHGVCFSIIFEKNFYFETPENSYNNNFRIIDLTQRLGLEKCDISYMGNNTINWEDVNDKLKVEKNKSHTFLEEAING